jgi:hypothetical protein
MVARHVEAALTRGIEADDEAVARTASTTSDPVLRAVVRRQVRRRLLVTMADLATTHHADPPPGHVMRVAVLQLRKQPIGDAGDPAQVTAAFAALPRRRPPSRLPWLIVLVVAGLALAAAGIAWIVLATEPGPPPSKLYERPFVAETREAYHTGGAPLHDAALEAMLRDGLATAVIAVDRYTRALDKGDHVDPADLAAKLNALARRTEITSLSPALAKAWTALMSQLVAWSNLSPQVEVFETASNELVMRTHDVSFQLAALGLGYFLDADVTTRGSSRDAWLYAYRVEQVSLVERDHEPMRVLNLRRLDQLNYAESKLGMQGEELGDPLVLLDQIDENVTTRDLRVLAATGSFRIGGDDWMNGNTTAVELRAKVDGAVRRELTAALGVDGANGAAVGALLDERAALLGDWRHHGMGLRTITTVFLPDSLLEQVKTSVPKLELRRAEQIETKLAALGAARLAANLGDALRFSVARHEAQHGYDIETTLRQPPDIEALVGPAEEHGQKRHFATRVRNETSAYLSQIASDPVTPHWALWSLADFAFDRDQWGGVYSHVAVIVLVELARELGAKQDGWVIVRGKVDRDRLAALAAVIAAADGDRLRQAAAASWTRLFGVPYRPIVDRAK